MTEFLVTLVLQVGPWPILAAGCAVGLLLGAGGSLILVRVWMRDLRRELEEIKWLSQQAMDLEAWRAAAANWGSGNDGGPGFTDVPELGVSEAAPGSAQSPPQAVGLQEVEPRRPDPMRKRAFVWVAGSSRGARGPSAFGLVVRTDSGETILRVGKRVGRLDRRNAIYRGVAHGLSSAVEHGMGRVVLFTSPIGKASAQEKISSMPGIQEPLRKKIRSIQEGLSQFEWVVVEPDRNKEAERLAREALLQRSRGRD